MPLSDEQLKQMQSVGVAWCNEAQFDALIKEVRELREGIKRVGDREAVNRKTVEGLMSEHETLRAQLDEAVKVLKKYSRDHDGDDPDPNVDSYNPFKCICDICQNTKSLLARLLPTGETK